MALFREYAATSLAAVLGVLVIGYAVLTPTNVLLGFGPAIVLLGLGLALDRYVL